MVDDKVKVFAAAASRWICDDYSLSIRYIVLSDNSQRRWLTQLFIQAVPFSVRENLSFRIDADEILTGQIQLNHVSRADALALIAQAIEGMFFLDGEKYYFYSQDRHYKSDMDDVRRIDRDLHLDVTTSNSNMEFPIGLIENRLREAEVPFDGIVDLVTWLGVQDPSSSQTSPRVSVRVAPPIMIDGARCTLENGRLAAFVVAHPNVDETRVGLGIRELPDNDLFGRRQLASSIRWHKDESGAKTGLLKVEVGHPQAALIILMLAGEAVKRHWVIDPLKANNNRLIATRFFDKDFIQIIKSIEGTDSKRLESAICSILFMLGFSLSPQVETEAPDIIVTTASGRMAIVESTLKTSDVHSKIGKLVHRKKGLEVALQSGAGAEVLALLVCAAQRDQIAISDEQLLTYGVVLVDRAELLHMLTRATFPSNHEQLYNDWVARATGELAER